MKRIRTSRLITLITVLVLFLTSCVEPPYATEESRFDSIVTHIDNDVSESDFCEYFEESFSEDYSYKCEGENGYYSELRNILSPLGNLDDIKIQHKVENDYVYFYFIYDDEKVSVGYISTSHSKQIYGVK